MLSNMIREVYKLVESKLPISTNFVDNIIESLFQFTSSPMLNQISINSNITEVTPLSSLIDGFLICALIHINIELLLRRVFGTELLLRFVINYTVII